MPSAVYKNSSFSASSSILVDHSHLFSNRFSKGLYAQGSNTRIYPGSVTLHAIPMVRASLTSLSTFWRFLCKSQDSHQVFPISLYRQVQGPMVWHSTGVATFMTSSRGMPWCSRDGRGDHSLSPPLSRCSCRWKARPWEGKNWPKGKWMWHF